MGEVGPHYIPTTTHNLPKSHNATGLTSSACAYRRPSPESQLTTTPPGNPLAPKICGDKHPHKSQKSYLNSRWLTNVVVWTKGLIGHAFTVRIRTGNQNQTSFYPFVPHKISVLVDLILGHLRYLLTDVPPQPNSPPNNVFRPDRPTKAPKDPPPIRPPTGTRQPALAARAARAVHRQPTGSGLRPPCPALRANPFPEVTDPFCRLPLPTLFHWPEAVHLRDLIRL
ncbi:hypothetical protein RJT34_20702 [Clitoria ternatea]|uniref:Regulator of rDNA transcription protein 15 n=1 Tax=Clitoria ternatea TaxID=43366 RepID=A0AAN9ITA2_CLITE